MIVSKHLKQIQEIAADAGVDPRTVCRVLQGKRVKINKYVSVLNALARAGIEVPGATNQ